MADESSKVTGGLAAELVDARPDDPVEVVIELHAPAADVDTTGAPDAASAGSRAEQIETRRRAFDEWSESVAERLRSVGGELVDRAWINSTVRGVVPAQGVPALAEDEKVERIDRPSRLAAD